MLRQLFIKNLVLIEELTVDFGEGLNVLTGETGAGKSIIIGAINLIMGERADRELIQSGKEYARVEGIFQISESNHKVRETLEGFGIPVEEDGTLILMRELSLGGKNICRINGRAVTLSMLREIGRLLMDVHGQHGQRILLSSDSQLDLLDRLGDDELIKYKNEVKSCYYNWRSVVSSIDKLTGISDRDIERHKDLLKYQIEEISRAALKPGEEEKLEAERLVLQNAEKIMTTVYKAYGELYSGGAGYPSISERLGMVAEELLQIANLDGIFDEISKQLKNIYYQLEDVIIELRNYKESFYYDQSRLEEVESRLELIRTLKRKYGSSIQEILQFKKQLELELEDIENKQQKIKELIQAEKKAYEKLVAACFALSKKRRQLAAFLEKQLLRHLSELGMDRTRFKVVINSPDDREGIEYIDKKMITAEGYDRVEFMISPNPGEPLRPLNKIISGGEMSRVMLAFKTILAGMYEIPTLIFDEIDVGISGRIAQVVAEKMGAISRLHQIVCVTHLPQIAAMADTHFRIEKRSEGGRTFTTVRKLDTSSRQEELARMIGGRKLSRLSLDHALEMINAAQKFKEKLSLNGV